VQYSPASESSPRAATVQYNSTFHDTSYNLIVYVRACMHLCMDICIYMYCSRYFVMIFNLKSFVPHRIIASNLAVPGHVRSSQGRKCLFEESTAV
jgi:hypothetical protein